MSVAPDTTHPVCGAPPFFWVSWCGTHNSGQGVLTVVSCDHCSEVKDAYSRAEGGIRSAAGVLYILSLDMQGCVKDVLTVVETVH